MNEQSQDLPLPSDPAGTATAPSPLDHQDLLKQKSLIQMTDEELSAWHATLSDHVFVPARLLANVRGGAKKGKGAEPEPDLSEYV